MKSDDVSPGLRLRRLPRHAELEVSRYGPTAARRNALLATHEIETVLDVGANQGESGATSGSGAIVQHDAIAARA